MLIVVCFSFIPDLNEYDIMVIRCSYSVAYLGKDIIKVYVERDKISNAEALDHNCMYVSRPDRCTNT